MLDFDVIGVTRDITANKASHWTVRSVKVLAVWIAMLVITLVNMIPFILQLLPDDEKRPSGGYFNHVTNEYDDGFDPTGHYDDSDIHRDGGYV